MKDAAEGHSDEDLAMLRDSVARLLERAGGVERARKVRDAGEGWDPAVLRELAQAGVLGAGIGDAAGGLGMGLRAAGEVAVEVGRALAPEPVVALHLAAAMLERLAAEGTAKERLAELLGGEAVTALAFQERDARGLSPTIGCRLDGARLSGGKAWVAAAQGAERLLVVAEGASGLALTVCDPQGEGVAVSPRLQADGSTLSEIAFTDAPAETLAEGAPVAEALDAAVAEATALCAAELVGVASRALELTLEYLKTREQFGRPIGAFQALQHRAVDSSIATEVAAAGVREALARMDRTGAAAARRREASRAKARATAAAVKVTREAIQLHGAVGYTDEFDVGLYLNRALVLGAWLGDGAFHRRRWLELREETAR